MLPFMMSCFNEVCPIIEGEDDSVVISFYISGASLPTNPLANTRATDAITSYENEIDIPGLKIFFKHNNNDIELSNLRIYKEEIDSEVYQVIATIDVPSSLLNSANDYRMEVFANCDETSSYDSNLTYNFDKSSYFPGSQSSKKYIPMWGATTKNLTLKLGERSDIGRIHLLRALSKIEISLIAPLPFEYKFEGITLSSYNNSGYALPYKSNEILQTNSSPSETNIPVSTTAISLLPFHLNEDSTKAYIYLPECSSTSGLQFSINIRNKEFNTLKTYIKGFNPNAKDDFNKIIRNHIYKYSITGIKDTEEIECTYTIKDWSTKTTEVDSEDFHWLWIKDEVLYMNNVSQIKTIFDSSTSDLVYTVSEIKVYKENRTWVGGGTISVNIDNTFRGDININSTIPTNFLGKEFIVTVSSAISGKSAQVKVYQFPPLYISAEQTGVKWTDSQGQTNSNMYVFTALLPDLSTIPNPDDRNNGPSNTTWNRGASYAAYLREQCAFGFPQTTETNLSDFASSSVNTANSRKYYAGPVKVLTTVGNVENNRLVSPRFALASQAGMNVPNSSYISIFDHNYTIAIPQDPNVNQYNSNYHKYMKHSMKQFCERYREFNADGVEYGPGTWRAPTKAEVYLIDVLQNVVACAVKKILEGGAYWGADANMVYMMDPRVSSGTSTAAIRCVRDIK